MNIIRLFFYKIEFGVFWIHRKGWFKPISFIEKEESCRSFGGDESVWRTSVLFIWRLPSDTREYQTYIPGADGGGYIFSGCQRTREAGTVWWISIFVISMINPVVAAEYSIHTGISTGPSGFPFSHHALAEEFQSAADFTGIDSGTSNIKPLPCIDLSGLFFCQACLVPYIIACLRLAYHCLHEENSIPVYSRCLGFRY